MRVLDKDGKSRSSKTTSNHQKNLADFGRHMLEEKSDNQDLNQSKKSEQKLRVKQVINENGKKIVKMEVGELNANEWDIGTIRDNLSVSEVNNQNLSKVDKIAYMLGSQDSLLKVDGDLIVEVIEQAKFKRILDLDQITYEDLCASLDVKKSRAKVFKAGQGSGASGSFFFFSADNRFLIKTLQNDETNVILQILDNFIKHIEETKNRSMICRVYGVFRVKTPRFAAVDVMIMQNVAKL